MFALTFCGPRPGQRTRSSFDALVIPSKDCNETIETKELLMDKSQHLKSSEKGISQKRLRVMS